MLLHRPWSIWHIFGNCRHFLLFFANNVRWRWYYSELWVSFASYLCQNATFFIFNQILFGFLLRNFLFIAININISGIVLALCAFWIYGIGRVSLSHFLENWKNPVLFFPNEICLSFFSSIYYFLPFHFQKQTVFMLPTIIFGAIALVFFYIWPIIYAVFVVIFQQETELAVELKTMSYLTNYVMYYILISKFY